MSADDARRGQEACEATLSVDLDALAANYRLIAATASPAETAPVVKSDAYGLGAGPIARRLWAEGARSFFVARLCEGEALRGQLGDGRPATVLVLDGCQPGSAPRLAAAALSPVLNSLEQVAAWSAHGRARDRPLDAALHIDTGMNRLGLGLADTAVLAGEPDRMRGFGLSLVLSHLACADRPDHPMNPSQAARFGQAAMLFPGVRRSLASSGGVFLGPAYALDMVRPGISLYGGGPFGAPDGRVRAVATLHAPIVQVREVCAGEPIGYGAAFHAARPMRIAVAAAGYTDGVLRAASPGGYGWLDGAPCAFVGRISMDLIALDVTDHDAARAGATVELLGPNVALDDLARAAGTLSHEVLARIGARTRRLYVGAQA